MNGRTKIQVENNLHYLTENNIDLTPESLTINDDDIFGIHGGGNIGLGLMADILNKSPRHYRIIATTNNELNKCLINATHRLWLQHSSHDDNHTTCIKNVEMISRNRSDIIRLYTESTALALCVTPTIMPNIARDIAHGLLNRYQVTGSNLKILVLMNKPQCDQFVKNAISHELLLLTNQELTDHILSRVELIPTVIDRIVAPIPQEKIKSQLIKQMASINRGALSRHFGTKSIETIIDNPNLLAKAVSIFNLQFNLFYAEKHFSMHAPDHFALAKQLPLINTTKDLATIEAIKNKYINGPHAILAWLGALFGYKKIAESIKHQFIYKFINDMMDNEIAPILTAEFSAVSQEELTQLKQTFFKRCADNEDDTVIRVGRDPMRKIDQGGRIRGTMELAKKHGVSTPCLELGVAACILYAIKKIDPENPGCQQLAELYQHNRTFSSMLCYQGPAPSGHFTGYDYHKDRNILNNILAKINALSVYLTTNHVMRSSHLRSNVLHIFTQPYSQHDNLTVTRRVNYA